MTSNHRSSNIMGVMLTAVVMIGSVLRANATVELRLANAEGTIKWGTTSDTNISPTTDITTDAFPGTFDATDFTTGNVLMYKFPVEEFTFTTNGQDSDNYAHDSIFAVSFSSAAFTKVADNDVFNIVVVSDDADLDTEQLCQGGETVDVSETLAKDEFENSVILNAVCSPDINSTSDVTVSGNIHFFITGTPKAYFHQCGVSLTGAVKVNTTALNDSNNLDADDFTSGTATKFSCGCTINPTDGISYTNDKLTIDVKIEFPGSVTPPYVVFQLSRKGNSTMELLVTDEETVTATQIMSYGETWDAASVSGTFTTGDATATTTETTEATAVVPDFVSGSSLTADSTDAEVETYAKTVANLVGFKTDEAGKSVATNSTADNPVEFEFDFKSELCLSASGEDVSVACFLYGKEPGKDKVSAEFAANFVTKAASQSFTCNEDEDDDSGATAKIGFSVFLLALITFAIEL